MNRACTIRGLDITAGNVTLPRMMSVHPGIKGFISQHVNCPLHPWPTGQLLLDPYLIKLTCRPSKERSWRNLAWRFKVDAGRKPILFVPSHEKLIAF